MRTRRFATQRFRHWIVAFSLWGVVCLPSIDATGQQTGADALAAELTRARGLGFDLEAPIGLLDPAVYRQAMADAYQRRRASKAIEDGQLADAAAILNAIAGQESHDEELIDSLRSLADAAEGAGDFALGLASWQRIVTFTRDRYGPNDWRVADAQLRARRAEQVADLTPEQRLAWSNAVRIFSDGYYESDAVDGAVEESAEARAERTKRRIDESLALVRELFGADSLEYANQFHAAHVVAWDEDPAARAQWNDSYIDVLDAVYPASHPKIASVLFGFANDLQYFVSDPDHPDRTEQDAREQRSELLKRASGLIRGEVTGAGLDAHAGIGSLPEQVLQVAAELRGAGRLRDCARVLHDAEIVALSDRIFGAESWQAADARQTLDEADHLAALGEEQQELISRERACWTEVMQALSAEEPDFTTARQNLDEAIAIHDQALPDHELFAADAAYWGGVIDSGLSGLPLLSDEYEINGRSYSSLDGARPLDETDRILVDEARGLLRKSVEARRRLLTAAHPAAIDALRQLVRLDLSLVQHAERGDDRAYVDELENEIVQQLSEAFGPDNWRTLEARHAVRITVARRNLTSDDLGTIQRAQEDCGRHGVVSEEADVRAGLDAHRRCVEALDAFDPAYDLWTYNLTLRRLQLLARLGRIDAIGPAYAKLMQRAAATHGADGSLTERINQAIVDLLRADLNDPELADFASDRFDVCAELLATAQPRDSLRDDQQAAIADIEAEGSSRYRTITRRTSGWSGRDSRLALGFESYTKGLTRTVMKGFDASSDKTVRALSRAMQAEVAFGDYAAAISIGCELVDQVEAIHGDASHEFAQARVELASLYLDIGDFSAAEELLLETKSSLETNDRRTSPAYAMVASNLGVLAARTSQLGEALAHFQEAVTTLTGLAEPDDLLLAHARANLAVCLQLVGRAAESDAYFAQSLDYFDHASPGDPTAIFFSVRRASAMVAQQKFDEAEQLLRNTELQLLALSSPFPLVQLELVHVRSLLHAERGDADAAAELARQSLAAAHRFFTAATGRYSERRQIAVAAAMKSELDLLLTVAAPASLANPADYGAILRWKGALQAARIEAPPLHEVVAAGDAEIASAVIDAQFLASELATAAIYGPQIQSEVMMVVPEAGAPAAKSSDSPMQAAIEAWQTDVRRMASELEVQSSQLARLSQPESDAPPAPPEELCRRLQSALAPGEALVDYYVYLPATTELRLGEEGTDRRELLAFVVTHDSVACRALGPMSPIIRAVAEWRTLYGSGPRTADNPGQILRQLLWEPLEDALAGASVIIVSPDGPLHDVSFAALPGTTQPFLIMEAAVAVAPSPQAIPNLLTAPQRRGNWNGLLTEQASDEFAAPDAPVAAAAPGPPVMLLMAPIEFAHEFSYVVTSPADDAFLPSRGALSHLARVLRYTKNEVTDIADLFEQDRELGIAVLRRGNLATKERFRAEAPRSNWVHLATHGVFLPGRSVDGRERALTHRLALSSDTLMRHDLGAMHPGLTSGLLFAADPEADGVRRDDFLSAAELAAIDLRNVDLLVLSACQTAVGETLNGEGLASLQRAAHMAGARSVLSTLWVIDDRQSRDLMQLFYENILDKGMTKVQALQHAQLEMIEASDRGADPPEAGAAGYLSPKYWAGFVLSGNWRSTGP